MRILIAGCGDVGARLGLLLAREGHEVFGLRRRPARLPPAITGIAADLGDRESLGALPGDLDLLYYTAAAERSTEEAYRRAYVEGLANVLAAVGEGVGRVVFVGSTAVYGQNGGEWVDETSPTEPSHFRGRTLLAAEALLADLGSPALAVRFGGIYGPGRTRLIDSVRRGEAVCRDEPPWYTNRIHADDCAAVLRHLGQLENPHPIYLGVDSEPAPDGEVKRWMARHLGVPEPPSDRDRPGVSRPPGQNKRCANRRLLASGYVFLYPDYRAGYGAL